MQTENQKEWNTTQKEKKELRRNKKCVVCNNSFVDLSKRLSSSCCTPFCSKQLGVEKRKQNNSYSWTEKQKEKVSETFDKLKKEGKLAQTDEAKNKIKTFYSSMSTEAKKSILMHEIRKRKKHL